jgi:lipid-A-disaccharide synthase|tara:strand:+ start:877 stop:2034 length:1158 start_codon:yes stop_codon:yes gene_type:complete
MNITPLRIAIVTGEASGDILGAGLMEALQKRHKDIVFEGIGGPKMLDKGFNSLFAMDRLAVMGLVEPLKRLPELLRIRKSLRLRWLDNLPDVMIGIDSPDFNLDLELPLRRAGIKTAHYVSPSVWAWRKKRIVKIAKAVDLMLTLLPFEAEFYRQHNVPVTFVGHPLADDLPLEVDVLAARTELGFTVDDKILALMPGSRSGEVERLAPMYLEVAKRCLQRFPQLKIVLPAASNERRVQLEKILADGEELPLMLIDGQSHTAMAAADTILMASGTTALEALLLKKPMVVGYKLAELSYQLLRFMVKIPWLSLPNLLTGRELVPEFIRRKPTVNNLTASILSLLDNPSASAALSDEFLSIHKQLRCNASERAADAVLNLIDHGPRT